MACEKPGIVKVDIGELFMVGVSCLRCRVRSCATGGLSTKGKLGDVAGSSGRHSTYLEFFMQEWLSEYSSKVWGYIFL